MNALLHGQPHGALHGQPHGMRGGTVSAKGREGKAPDLTGPDLMFVCSPLHHVVAYVTREARIDMMPLRARGLT